MQSNITEEYSIYLFTSKHKKQETFNPLNEEHVEFLKKEVNKIVVYLEVPGLDCASHMFDKLNNALYAEHMCLYPSACVFIPIDNIDVQKKTIEKQSSKINNCVDDIREKFNKEVVKRLNLGENYFDKFRETWIGFSQGGPIAFEGWWHIYNKNLDNLKALNYTSRQKEPSHRLVLCNTGLFGCSSLDIADSIIEYIPDETLPPGTKDLSKKRSKKRVAERWMALNNKNCLLAGSLSNTQEEKKQYVENMLGNMNLNSDFFNFQDLILPLLPKGDCCFSAEDQFPTRLTERDIKSVFLKGHHAEILFIDKNIQTLAHRIVHWPV